MDSATLDAALAAQRGYFASGATLALEARRAALRRLYGELQQREGDVAAALRADLGKCPEEAYMCETGLLLGGIRYLERHLPALMRARRAMVSEASAALCAITSACGSAMPMSSQERMTMRRAMKSGSSPASSMRAR